MTNLSELIALWPTMDEPSQVLLLTLAREYAKQYPSLAPAQNNVVSLRLLSGGRGGVSAAHNLGCGSDSVSAPLVGHTVVR